ncbi:hypothetical protein MSG28_000014 [Choristoneura fumiferana]|uniref:Uncharacterized protein n=1 Tax=Choristoneura fumiferana TaxID=7141 RepID=A0ACC0JZ56_CHOFU|nr:hypothetical protein MSG28_000014 [Choristoneura fumiferana]
MLGPEGKVEAVYVETQSKGDFPPARRDETRIEFCMAAPAARVSTMDGPQGPSCEERLTDCKCESGEVKIKSKRHGRGAVESDKINRVCSDGKRYVRRPPNKAFDPKYTKVTLKHGGGNVKIWGCFSGHGVGPVRLIEGNMDQFQYKNILEETMLPYAEGVLPVIWTFQHDNDPKHTACTVKEFLTSQSVSVLDWPANSPDLNPIEHLWCEVKKRFQIDSRFAGEYKAKRAPSEFAASAQRYRSGFAEDTLLMYESLQYGVFGANAANSLRFSAIPCYRVKQPSSKDNFLLYVDPRCMDHNNPAG